jgi:hypothetical protein
MGLSHYGMTREYARLAAGTEGQLVNVLYASGTDLCHRIRLYSTKSFKPLGTLVHHNEALQTLCLANTPGRASADEEDEDEDEDGFILTPKEKESRGRWMLSGSKDGKVAIWELMNFSSR